MENANDGKSRLDENFEADFLSRVKNPIDDVVVHQKKNSKQLRIIVGVAIAVVLAVVLIIVGVVLLGGAFDRSTSVEEDGADNNFFEANTSMIEVLVAPSSAKVMIDGKPYSNGEYELSVGEYDVVVEEEGFESYRATILVSDKHKTYVATCLQPMQGNEKYYDDNLEQYSTCQVANEIADVSAWDQTALMDEIFEYTPFHNDKEGFYVDPYYDDNDNLIVELSFKDCSQTEVILEERAYDWMRKQGLNPDDYTFERTWDCEE